MKKFNVTGLCTPEEDYMVDISEKIKQIKQLVDRRSYFTINRARQYGKTTTLNTLKKTLSNEYICINLSFEGVGTKMFANAQSFCQRFLRQLEMAAKTGSNSNEKIEWQNNKVTDFDELSVHLTQICADKKIVLMIDEVDKTSNNQVFLHFLSMLRAKFLARKEGSDHTFHSVILAGVYDVKNIKLKMISEGLYTPGETEEKIYNSPWNIAADFKIDMAFNPAEISTMLTEYEADHDTGMDIAEISAEIYGYTSGYPFLVSRICQCVDEELGKDWTKGGIRKAAGIIIDEHNTLFDDIYKNLANNRELYQFIYNILIPGESYSFKISNEIISLANMYGMIVKKNGVAAVSNQIFETIIYDYFISKDETNIETRKIKGVITDIIKNGKFDMELCLRKFADHYNEIFTEKDVKFLERHGRLLFLSYLRPLINGRGFYHIESETRNQRRMDIVVDYGSDQFIIELKIWDGEKYNQEAYKQLIGYMDAKKANIGYLLTFDFRKSAKRKAEWLEIGGKKIFDVII